MSEKERGEGIVFKKEEIRESDILYSALSKEWGRVTLLGKGIRKIGAKLKSQIEKMNLVEFEFVQGKEFKILTDANLISNFSEMKKNFFKLNLGLKVCELLDSFLKEGQGEDVWEMTLAFFNFLNKKRTDKKLSLLAFFWFFWNFFQKLGTYPSPQFCFLCQKELKEGFFDSKTDAFLCPKCAKKSSQKVFVEKETVSLLKKILSSDIILIKELRLSQGVLKNLNELSKNVFENLKNQYGLQTFF